MFLPINNVTDKIKNILLRLKKFHLTGRNLEQIKQVTVRKQMLMTVDQTVGSLGLIKAAISNSVVPVTFHCHWASSLGIVCSFLCFVV